MPQAASITTRDPDTIEVVESLQSEDPSRYASLSKAIEKIVREWATQRAVERAKSLVQPAPVGTVLDKTA